MDYVTRQFINLAKHLRKDCRAALARIEKVIQKNTNTIRDTEERHRQDRHIHPFWLETLISRYEQTVTEKTTETNRNYLTQVSIKRAMWCTFVVTVLAFLAAAYYACVTKKILETSQKQTPLIEESAKAAEDQTSIAQKSLDAANRNFRTDERAWIVPNFTNEAPQPFNGIFGTTYVVHFEVKNQGKTVAKDVQGSIAAVVLHTDDHVLLSPCLEGGTVTNLAAFFPGTVHHAFPELDEVVAETQRLRPIKLDQDLIKALSTGDRAVVGCGKIRLQRYFFSAHPALRNILPSLAGPSSPGAGIRQRRL